MGVKDPSTFDYVTAPSRAALLKALKTLAMLGALDKAGDVTPDGKKMAALPLDPAFAHLLVRYYEYPCRLYATNSVRFYESHCCVYAFNGVFYRITVSHRVIK